MRNTNIRTHFATLAAVLLLGAYSATTVAADAPSASPKQSAGKKEAAPKEAAKGKGTVTKVDADAGVVTLKHEAISALRWPPMTMDFKVTDKKLLSGLQPGQVIDFGLVKEGPGTYVISRISAAK